MRALIVSIFILIACPAWGAVFHVNPADGFVGIQTAIDASTDGDEIVLAPGIYASADGSSIENSLKAITIRSQDPNDANIVANTILRCPSDANSSNTAFESCGPWPDEMQPVTLAGLTITGGKTQPAVSLLQSASIMRACIVRDNLAGGISLCCESEVIFEDCLFENNVADQGGAIFDEDWSGMILTRCLFQNNRARIDGGAVYSHRVTASNCQWIGNRATQGGAIGFKWNKNWDLNGGFILSNNLFVGNRADEMGGALYSCNMNNIHTELTNCTFAGNRADDQGGAIYFDAEYTDLELSHTIIFYNQDSRGIGRSIHFNTSEYSEFTSYYSCLQLEPDETTWPFADSNDSFHADPCFVRIPDGGSDGWGDDPETTDIDESLNDDYGDLSLQASSPCVNTGYDEFWNFTGQTDATGQPRVMGPCMDIGAVEFWQPGLKMEWPQADAVWASGSTQPIRWSSTAVEGNVDLQFSPDGGTSWQSLATNIPNTGEYAWAIPNELETQSGIIRALLNPSHPAQYIIDSGVFCISSMGTGMETTSAWSTLGGNVQRTGLSDLTGPITMSPYWDVNIPGKVYTSPTLGAQDHIHVASEDGTLYSFDLQGQLVWSVDVNTPLLSAPTVGSQGEIYVGGHDGQLYAFDCNGISLWTWQTEGFVFASCAVSDQGEIYVASQDGSLTALASDGSFMWSFEVPQIDPVPNALLASPAIGLEGMIYVGSLYGPTLYALDPTDGSIQWSCLCGDPNATRTWNQGQIVAAPVLGTSGMLYQGLASDPNLYAIDTQSGDIQWMVDLYHCIEKFEYIIENPGGGGRGGGSVTIEYGYRFGDTVFTNNIEPCKSILTEPTLGPDGTIYVSLDDPYLRAVKPDGTLQWIIQLGEGRGFSLVVGQDNLIYAAGDDGILYVVDAEGEILSQQSHQGQVAYPVIGPNGLFLLMDTAQGIRAYQELP